MTKQERDQLFNENIPYDQIQWHKNIIPLFPPM
jgi:hypothetical protein